MQLTLRHSQTTWWHNGIRKKLFLREQTIQQTSRTAPKKLSPSTLRSFSVTSSIGALDIYVSLVIPGTAWHSIILAIFISWAINWLPIHLSSHLDFFACFDCICLRCSDIAGWRNSTLAHGTWCCEFSPSPALDYICSFESSWCVCRQFALSHIPIQCEYFSNAKQVLVLRSCCRLSELASCSVVRLLRVYLSLANALLSRTINFNVFPECCSSRFSFWFHNGGNGDYCPHGNAQQQHLLFTSRNNVCATALRIIAPKTVLWRWRAHRR